MRIFFLRLSAVLLAATLAPQGAAAATLAADHVVVFGDSLSDNRRAHELSGGSIPQSPPYAPKRFSNGAIWVDHMARSFREAGGSVQNYALGGSTSLGITSGQIAAFALDGRRAPNMAAILASAHNDLEIIARNRPRGALGGLAADEAARMVARSVELNARALGDLGIRKVMVFNAVDIGTLPLYADDPRRAGYATRASAVFNAALDPALDRLRRDGFDVVGLDIATLFRSAIANPADFGFSNVTDACLSPAATICDDPDSHLFWDRRHPTAAAHRHLADLAAAHLGPASPAMQVQIAPVPVPAPALLLAAALMGLAAAARRRGG